MSTVVILYHVQLGWIRFGLFLSRYFNSRVTVPSGTEPVSCGFVSNLDVHFQLEVYFTSRAIDSSANWFFPCFCCFYGRRMITKWNVLSSIMAYDKHKDVLLMLEIEPKIITEKKQTWHVGHMSASPRSTISWSMALVRLASMFVSQSLFIRSWYCLQSRPSWIACQNRKCEL